jgi:protein O-GlcNAc transferase
MARVMLDLWPILLNRRGAETQRRKEMAPFSGIKQTFDLAKQLHRAGQLGEAEKLYRRIIAAEPKQADSLHLLGVVLHQTGRKDEALELIQRSIVISPRCAEAHYHLARILTENDLIDLAMSAYRRAIQLKPGYAEALNNLGSLLAQQRQFGDALLTFQQAIIARRDYAEAQFNVGKTLHELGRLDEALEAYQRAISLKNNYAEAHNNQGQILSEFRQPEQALACFERCLVLQPGNARALNNQGNAQKDLGQLDAAVDSFQRAIAANPNLAEAHNNLGNVLKDQGVLDEAVNAYRRAADLDPTNCMFASNLLYLLHFHPAYDARAIAAEQNRWNRQYVEPIVASSTPTPTFGNTPEPLRRLKIGYVSPDFRDHVQSLFTVPVLSHHDHEGFEIFAYSSTKRPDKFTQQIAGYIDCWRDVGQLDDAALCEVIRADGIDILVDLTMQMAGGRPMLFARRPAPVAVAWLAYPASTGLLRIDYRLSDPYLDPPGMDETIYAEQTIRLPSTFWCYDPLDCRDIPVNSLPAIDAGVVTFGCLNNFCKVNENAIMSWARVLARVENSRLLLLAQPGSHRQRVVARFEEHGIAGERIEFVPVQPRAEYLKTYHRIDIGLDTFPYNGHTTSLDSFWMGVPVVTLAGNTAVGRAGLCQLSNLGLSELAGQSEPQFAELAVRLAADLQRLQQLRATLRSRMQESPLMDPRRFATDLQSQFRWMWMRWCEQQG